MQIRDWGEESFIQYLCKLFPIQEPLYGIGHGIGDDCAVIPAEDESVWLVTTDALVEKVHFLKELMQPEDIGYKSVAVNLSDIAAMGGSAKYIFLTIALPNTIDCDWLKRLIQGVKEACDAWKVLLLGGDTVGSKGDIFLSLTAIGSAKKRNVKYRHTAQPGDLLCVSGFLGDSGAGFCLLKEGCSSASAKALIHAHVHPAISLKEGEWLGSQEAVHAMMDVSDGLDCDLRRILRASNCGAEIELSKLLISEALLQESRTRGWNVIDFALVGGEDYCLLFTVQPEKFEAISQEFYRLFRRPLYCVGRITDQPNQLIYQQKGVTQELSIKSFSHF